MYTLDSGSPFYRDFLKFLMPYHFSENRLFHWQHEAMEVRVECIRGIIRREIFQGDSLSPLFVLCMVPLTWLLRTAKAGYEWSIKGFKLNHLLFMDDLELLAKIKNQTDSLVQTVHIYSEDIGMKFGIKKWGVLIMERRKIIRTDGIRLPDGQDMIS